MPIYEYKCENCGVIEVMQKITDDPLTTCPNCQGPVKKLISHSVGILFKGPGFYVTDNRKSDYKEKAKEDKEGKESSKAADS